jgi:hypothetical protein
MNDLIFRACRQILLLLQTEAPIHNPNCFQQESAFCRCWRFRGCAWAVQHNDDCYLTSSLMASTSPSYSPDSRIQPIDKTVSGDIARETETVSWTRPTRKMEAKEAGSEVSSASGIFIFFCAFLFPKSKSSDRKYASLQLVLEINFCECKKGWTSLYSLRVNISLVEPSLKGPQAPSMVKNLVEVSQAMNSSCVKGSEDPAPNQAPS